MAPQITNETLSVKLEATNGILSRVERKVDDMATNAVNPQVFELKIKELQVGISQNTVDILDIKKDMALDKKTALDRDEDKTVRKSNNFWTLIITVSGTAMGVLIGYLLTRK